MAPLKCSWRTHHLLRSQIKPSTSMDSYSYIFHHIKICACIFIKKNTQGIQMIICKSAHLLNSNKYLCIFYHIAYLVINLVNFILFWLTFAELSIRIWNGNVFAWNRIKLSNCHYDENFCPIPKYRKPLCSLHKRPVKRASMVSLLSAWTVNSVDHAVKSPVIWDVTLMWRQCDNNPMINIYIYI